MQHLKRFGILFAAVLLLVAGLSCFAGCDPAPSGTIYSLREAYENGLLTKEELMSIAYYHNGGRRYNEAIMGEDYTPIPKDPAELSEATSLQIRNTAAWEYQQEGTHAELDVTADGFQVQSYYGTYRGAVAAIIQCLYYEHPAVDRDFSYELDGVIVHYHTYWEIEVWVEN